MVQHMPALLPERRCIMGIETMKYGILHPYRPGPVLEHVVQNLIVPVKSRRNPSFKYAA